MTDVKVFGVQKEGIEYIERRGAYGIVIDEDLILIEKAKLGYFLPGGGIEEDETVEEALKREFLEETGYIINSSKKVGQAIEYLYTVDKDTEDSYFLKKVGYFHVVQVGTKSEPTYADGHHHPVEWIPIQEIKEKMYLESQWWAIEEVLRMRDW